MGQHGFARSELWTFSETIMDNDEAGVSVKFSECTCRLLPKERQLISKLLS